MIVVYGSRVRLVSPILSVGLILAFGSWAVRIVARRESLAHFNAVGSLDLLRAPSGAWLLVVAVGGVSGWALWRHRRLWSWRTPSVLAVVFVASTVAAFSSSIGQHLTILGSALLLGVVAALVARPIEVQSSGPTRSDVWVGLALWVFVFAIDAVFSMHRHAWFGSGSWDHGCMVHNFYRAAHLLPTVSTVLGGVDFLGDHFMVGIYLYAPIIWLSDSGYTVLAIQAAHVSAAAPAIYLIARHHRIDRFASGVLGLSAALSFGLQSAAYFDSHEITVGLGFLAFGLWAFETGRIRTATLLLVLFSLFKESLGAYVAALGLLAVLRGLMRRDRRHIIFGSGWVLYGVFWFVVVNRVLMPWFAAHGHPPEPHETFGDFGPTVFSAAVGILTDPLKSFLAIFVPSAKLDSHAVTLGHTGLVGLLAPQVGVAALPLVAERFLSSKSSMWEMGYHYAGPLCLYAGWATALGFSRARSIFRSALEYLGPGLGRRAGVALVSYLVLAGLLETAFGYRHPANFYTWRASYFSSPSQRVANHRAVDLLDSLDRQVPIAVQNRLLPHLANRPFIYRLADYRQADWVLLSVGESAWPYDAGLPRRLARQLHGDPEWRLVFSEEGAAVFARVSVTEREPAVPTPRLGLRPSRTKTAP